jgi:hypothetical protein
MSKKYNDRSGREREKIVVHFNKLLKLCLKMRVKGSLAHEPSQTIENDLPERNQRRISSY